MRPKSMILIIIAMGCGLVASIGISEVIERRTESSGGVSTSQIFVALVDVPIGTSLTAQMVKLEEWPEDKIPEGAIVKVEDIEGRRPRQPLFAGEPILQRKLIDPNSNFAGASGRIPKGFRVASVKVTMSTAASGLILPGDRVDVLVYLRSGTGISSPVTKTILTDVTVFAVNQEINRAVEGEASSIAAKTVSLLVKPDQVEKLMLAAEMGKLQLSLRRADDDSEVTSNGADLADLSTTESGQDAQSFGVTEKPAGQPSRLTSLLQQMEKSPQPSDLHGLDANAASVHEMEIHSPDGIQRYHWTDRQKLPVELAENVDGIGSSESSAGSIPNPDELDSDDDNPTDDDLDGGADEGDDF